MSTKYITIITAGFLCYNLFLLVQGSNIMLFNDIISLTLRTQITQILATIGILALVSGAVVANSKLGAA